MKRTAAPRIVMNMPELVALVQHRPLSFKIHGQQLELHLQRAITPKVLILALLDLLETATATTPDPPEAREFLSRR